MAQQLYKKIVRLPDSKVVMKRADRGIFSGRHLQFCKQVGEDGGNKTRVCWKPNVQEKQLFGSMYDRLIRIHALRCILGKADGYLLNTPYHKLENEMGFLRKAMMAKTEDGKRMQDPKGNDGEERSRNVAKTRSSRNAPIYYTDYYYSKFMYEDINLRSYFRSIRPPTKSSFGFRIGKHVLVRFPKATCHYLFVPRCQPLRPPMKRRGTGKSRPVKKKGPPKFPCPPIPIKSKPR